MNARKTVSLALFALTLATPVLAQSGTAVQNKRQAPDLLARLRPGWSHPATSVGSKSPAPDAVALGLATARVYRFSSADYPGANSSVVFDMNTTTETGFTLRGGVYQTFSVPGSAPGSALTGINSSGAMVGVYTDTSNVTHGVLDVAGVFTKIDDPSGPTTPFDINDNGEIVGGYSNGGVHGFSTPDSGVTFSNFDYPGATATIAAGVNTAGVITGQWTDSASPPTFTVSSSTAACLPRLTSHSRPIPRRLASTTPTRSPAITQTRPRPHTASSTRTALLPGSTLPGRREPS
jgi:hypothetical protein